MHGRVAVRAFGIEFDAQRGAAGRVAAERDVEAVGGGVGGDGDGPEAKAGPMGLERIFADDALLRRGAAAGGAGPKRERGGEVVLFGVIAHGAAGGEFGRKAGHAFPHAGQPRGRQTGGVARVEFGDHLLFEAQVECLGLGAVPRGIVAALLPVAERPADVGEVGLGPPAVQLGQIETAVDEHLHAAGAAGFPRALRSVDPHIHALHEVLGEEHVVVGEENHRRIRLMAADEVHPFLDQRLAGAVGGVRLAGEDELGGVLRMAQQPDQTRGIVEQKVRAFVGREAAREAEGQHAGTQSGLGAGDGGRCGAGDGHLAADAVTGVVDQGSAARVAQRPKRFVGHPAEVGLERGREAQPAAFAAGVGPELIGGGGIPGGHVHAVGHVSDGHFVLRPPREQGRKQMPAHAAVEAADAVDGAAAAHGEVGEIERLRVVVGILAAEREERAEREPEVFVGVTAEKVFDEGRSEAVEAGGHGGVGREDGADARGGEGDGEGLAAFHHEGARTFQNDKGRVSLVEMIDVGLESERRQHPATPEAEHHLLTEAHLGVAAVELAGDELVLGRVGGIV